jgi:hypothetical protein
MSDRDPSGSHPEDMPWNDVPADDDVIPGTEEPDPAEVTGSEDDDSERDSAAHQAPDPSDKYRRESLDERLAEEQPDRAERPAGAGGVQVYDADTDDDAGRAEGDDDDPTGGDQSAEEAAIHLTDEP